MNQTNSIIRPEKPEDYKAVEALVRDAFWNLYEPGTDLHFVVHTMRSHDDFIPELSFVIENDNEIVGSILYTQAKVIDQGGNEHKVISFGPVCIHPSLHRQGLGRALITHSIHEARRLGYKAIIIGGFPYHYHCYGFESTKKYGISMPDGSYHTGIMALPLYNGALDNIHGQIHFSDSLYVDKGKADIFDKAFSAKEKRVLPCQSEFEKAFLEIDEKEYN